VTAVVGKILAQGGLAAGAELAASEVVGGVIDAGGRSPEGILHQRAVGSSSLTPEE
jgi:hypothetical protein